MITPMMKYSLILYHNDYQDFLTRLQDLGLVDITITNWETTDSQRALMTQIEAYRQAGNRLRELEKEEAAQASAKGTQDAASASMASAAGTYPDSKAAYEAYRQAVARLEELNGELNRLTKEIEELQPWGEFDASQLAMLRKEGIELNFYTLFSKEYESHREEWSQQYALSEISRDSLRTYFIVAAPAGEEPDIDAQSIKAPTVDYRSKEAEADRVREKIKAQRAILIGCIPYRAGRCTTDRSASFGKSVAERTKRGGRNPDPARRLGSGRKTSRSGSRSGGNGSFLHQRTPHPGRRSAGTAQKR